ncbi:MAG TPA: response regulator [Burkholderiales bacterium]|nr:response regulator [Burkholderiales bacterium]
MSAPKAVVLVVEDEPAIRHFLRTALGAEGFEVIDAENAARGLTLAANSRPDCVILDLGLPDLDGVQFLKKLREWNTVPVIVLSARLQEDDKIAALDAGADDYLTKPFGVGELHARLRVALRHGSATSPLPQSPILEAGDLRVDVDQRRVMLGNAEIHLTPIEYRLLVTLLKHHGKVLTHSFLLKEVWGAAYADRPHYLRIYMANLRQKLEPDPAQPRRLLTETGVGYRLVDP